MHLRSLRVRIAAANLRPSDSISAMVLVIGAPLLCGSLGMCVSFLVFRASAFAGAIVVNYGGAGFSSVVMTTALAVPPTHARRLICLFIRSWRKWSMLLSGLTGASEDERWGGDSCSQPSAAARLMVRLIAAAS